MDTRKIEQIVNDILKLKFKDNSFEVFVKYYEDRKVWEIFVIGDVFEEMDEPDRVRMLSKAFKESFQANLKGCYTVLVPLTKRECHGTNIVEHTPLKNVARSM